MADRPFRRPPIDGDFVALKHTTAIMGARMPQENEIAAIRAVMRGHAEQGQQRVAMAYLMAELCGVGRIRFHPEPGPAAFTAGAQAVGIAFAQIAGVEIMRFPSEGGDGHSDN